MKTPAVVHATRQAPRGGPIVDGLRAATKLRLSRNIPLNEAVCIYDVVEQLGIELRFDAIPSLEGMYAKGSNESPPIILLSCLRPDGRRASTCAHELGHHVFEHGTRVDEYVANTSGTTRLVTPEEKLANAFAGFFLMPKAAVERGFAMRGTHPTTATSTEVFTVATWLGVGYSTLVNHMRWSLHLIDDRRTKTLLATSPAEIRRKLVGSDRAANIAVVDAAWTGRPVDVHVGDLVIAPRDVLVDQRAPLLADSGEGELGAIWEAKRPGIGRIATKEWSTFVRVSRRGYIGRGLFRHLEPAPDDEGVDEL